MSRVDVPTMRCDRCGVTTDVLDEMGRYRNLRGQYDGYQSARENWDLCPECWTSFVQFLAQVAAES